MKLALGVGESLVGRLLVYDALRLRFRDVVLRRDPDCPVCGDAPTIRNLSDHRGGCQADPLAAGLLSDVASPTGGAVVSPMSVEALKVRLDEQGTHLVLLDVREPHELAICRIPSARNIPLGELAGRLSELDPSHDLVVLCRSGTRSARAVALLQARGFHRTWSLDGGILAWIDRIDPSLAPY